MFRALSHLMLLLSVFTLLLLQPVAYASTPSNRLSPADDSTPHAPRYAKRSSGKKKKVCTESKSRTEVALTNNSQATVVFYRRYTSRKSSRKVQETIGTIPPTSVRTFRARMRVGRNEFIYAPFCTITPVAAADGSHATVVKKVREAIPRRGTCTKKLEIVFEDVSFLSTGFTCDKVSGAPFELLSVAHAVTFPINREIPEPLFISYSGLLEFPITITYSPRTCAPGANCEVRKHSLLAAPPAGEPIVFPKAIHCAGTITAPTLFDYEVFITDSRSRESNRLAAPFSCIP